MKYDLSDISLLVRDLSLQDPKTLNEKTLKLMDEAGTLCKNVLAYTSTAGSKHINVTSLDLLTDCVDVYLVLQSIMIQLQHNSELTDEVFLDKILEKTNKWQAIQTREMNIAQKTIAYEIHVTIDNENDATIANFQEFCNNYNIKPVIIIMDGIPSHVMTETVVCGSVETAHNSLAGIVKVIKDNGFKVIREKIETVPWHPCASQKVGDIVIPYSYFEVHIPVQLGFEYAHRDLVQKIINNSKRMPQENKRIMLSNTQKQIDKNVKLLTYRFNNIDYNTFNSIVEEIMGLLQVWCPKECLEKNNNFNFRPIIEFVLYDSNESLDQQWIDSIK